jgi:hypothetical protein
MRNSRPTDWELSSDAERFEFFPEKMLKYENDPRLDGI